MEALQVHSTVHLCQCNNALRPLCQPCFRSWLPNRYKYCTENTRKQSIKTVSGNDCGTVCEELEDTQYLWHRACEELEDTQYLWHHACEELEDTQYLWHRVWGTWGFTIFVAPCVWGTWGYTIFVAPCVWGGYTIFVAPCVRGTWGYTISYNPHFVLPISPTDSRHRSRTESVVFSSWYIEIVMHSHTCSFGTIPLFRDLSNLQFWISCILPYPLPYLQSFLLATDQKPRAGMAWE